MLWKNLHFIYNEHHSLLTPFFGRAIALFGCSSFWLSLSLKKCCTFIEILLPTHLKNINFIIWTENRDTHHNYINIKLHLPSHIKKFVFDMFLFYKYNKLFVRVSDQLMNPPKLAQLVVLFSHNTVIWKEKYQWEML